MYGTNNTANAVPLHPNVKSHIERYLNPNGSIPYTAGGSMISFTWDGSVSSVNDQLKVSFILEHGDYSNNTGFTLFDFDNDGKMDICYRDQTYLRIISADAPYYIPNSATPNNTPGTPGYLIKFRQFVNSNTGFEYPVIADIDGDSSADIVVTGNNTMTFFGHVFAVEGNRVQFAPAPKVWNQFMYSPLKINEDLTVPQKVYNPLSDEYAYIKDKDNPDVKDYIYNNTITQTPFFSIFTDGISGVDYWAPVVRQPDAVVKAKVNSINSTLEITIRNTGTATLNSANPVGIYYGDKNTTVFNASNFMGGGALGVDLFPGEEKTVSFTISDTNRDFIIRVSDASVKADGTFDSDLFGQVYLECVWETNIAYASAFQVNDVAIVTEPHKTITFNPLDNDILTASCTDPIITFGQIPQESGTFVTDSDGNVTYTSPFTTPNGVVELEYTVECNGVEKSASVYIFVLENASNTFAACYGSSIVIDLKEKPVNTTFVWYQSAAEGSATTSAPGTIYNLDRNREFYVQPKAPNPYAAVVFPTYTLKVTVIGDNADDIVQMRWTGAASDREWGNPLNWVEIVDASTTRAVAFAPSKCVDVEIPGNISGGYPTLSVSGSAGQVHLKDRAMLANTHKLDYDSATVEINLKSATERDRWVMYSSPLRRVYSGDFMLLDNNNNPMNQPPAVYMNFFQAKNPDDPSSVAQAKIFSNSFGNAGVPLPLGKAFNVWIDTDVDTTTPFRFPSIYEKYEYWIHGVWGGTVGDGETLVLERREELSPGVYGNKVNGRFIVEDATNTQSDGSFTLTPPDDAAGFDLLMLPNPFMAYMDMNAFLTDNASVLNNEYKIWRGTKDAFVTYKEVPVMNFGYYWIADEDPDLDDLTTYRYVAPLQSFIVSKVDPSQTISVSYEPESVLTTQRLGSADYDLRSGQQGDNLSGVMKISASSGDLMNSTVLVNSPEASNGVTEDDALKLFYDKTYYSETQGDIPLPHLTVYTLSPDNTPLAINVSGDFIGQQIPVGLRLSVEGQLKLDFSGVTGFGYEVVLLDGNNEINLTENPVYYTTIQRRKEGYYEVNDRFKLSFPRIVLGMEDQGVDPVTVSSSGGRIYVSSNSPMQSVEVISALGVVVYRSDIESQRYAIDAYPGQIYMVKVNTGKGTEVRKVIVK